MNFKFFFSDESGDTNIVSLIIILAIVIIAVILFKSYAVEIVEWIKGLIS